MKLELESNGDFDHETLSLKRTKGNLLYISFRNKENELDKMNVKITEVIEELGFEVSMWDDAQTIMCYSDDLTQSEIRYEWKDKLKPALKNLGLK